VTTIPKDKDFDNAISECCEPFFKKFKINGILRRCYAIKHKGISAYATFLFLVGLVFTGKNLYTLLKKEHERVGFEKDVVYRFLGDSQIHWELILSGAANAVIPELKEQTSECGLTANVIDDSTYYRNRSKKVELLSRCHDHTSKDAKYYKGFVLLCLGWTDGETFMPVKSQMVASGDDKNLLEGSHVKEDNRTLATRRRKDARKEKPALVLQMLESIKGTPAQTGHVLFDSWFQSPLSMISIKNIGYDVVARAKNNENYRYLYNGEMKSIKQVYNANKKRRGRSRYLLSVDIQIKHANFDKPILAKLVYVRNKKDRKKWIALISTDTSLSEDQIIALYGLRWDIEPFFKVMKSYLQLEKEFQTRSFDAITAHATVVMIRYMILAFRNRGTNTAGSVCDVFFTLCKELDNLSFKYMFSLITETIRESLSAFLQMSTEKINAFMAHFMSIMPDYIKAQLDSSTREI